jgi:hypothetical protein
MDERERGAQVLVHARELRDVGLPSFAASSTPTPRN